MVHSKKKQIPRGLKSPRNDKNKGLVTAYGAAEAAPFQNERLKTSARSSFRQPAEK
jgi:hypothetical protein